MRVIWLAEARADIADIRDYIGEDNPQAAKMVIRKIFEAARQLTAVPSSGRPGRISGSRELVVSGLPYIVPYRVTETHVEVLRVIHAARHWP